MRANSADDAQRDIANAISKGRELKNDARAISQAATQAASGNIAGAALVAVKNPKTALKVLCVALALFLSVVVFFTTFTILMPASIVGSGIQKGASWFDSFRVEAEGFFLQIQNGVSDFFSLLTTGEWGDSYQEFSTDVAVASGEEFSAYYSTSNMLVAVMNEYFRDTYNKKADWAERTVRQSGSANSDMLDKTEAYDETSCRREAARRDVESEYFTYNLVSGMDDTQKQWLEPTFAIMSMHSVRELLTGGSFVSFPGTEMLQVAKDIDSRTWAVTAQKEMKYGVYTEVIIEYLRGEFGELILDSEGNAVELSRQEIEHKTCVCTVTYDVIVNPTINEELQAYFGIPSREEELAGATGDIVCAMDIVDENIANLRKMYATALLGDMTEFWENFDWDSIEMDSSASRAQNAVAYVAQHYAQFGISCSYGYCQGWVADVYKQALGEWGYGRLSAATATAAWRQWGVSSSLNGIPVGAAVYSAGTGVPAGHVGIHVGGGIIAHNWGGRIVYDDLSTFVSRGVGQYRGWGWNGGIALPSLT